jgi:hypothetical protein
MIPDRAQRRVGRASGHDNVIPADDLDDAAQKIVAAAGKA